jgi:hypothetical protein
MKILFAFTSNRYADRVSKGTYKEGYPRTWGCGDRRGEMMIADGGRNQLISKRIMSLEKA